MDDISVNDVFPVNDDGPLDDFAPVNPCDDCGRTAAGQHSKEGDFYCFDCWDDGDPSDASDMMITPTRDPDSIPFHEYMYKNDYDYDKR